MFWSPLDNPSLYIIPKTALKETLREHDSQERQRVDVEALLTGSGQEIGELRIVRDIQAGCILSFAYKGFILPGFIGGQASAASCVLVHICIGLMIAFKAVWRGTKALNGSSQTCCLGLCTGFGMCFVYTGLDL